jgi:hypothetical protein
MITYTTLKDRPREFLTATGLTHDEFLRVWPAFGAAYTAGYARDTTWHGTARRQTHPLHTMHGGQGGLRQPQPPTWIPRVWRRAG